MNKVDSFRPTLAISRELQRINAWKQALQLVRLIALLERELRGMNDSQKDLHYRPL
jgi:hypothetical protein